MLLTEWNWDDALEVAREEGREDGLEEEKILIAKNLLLEGSSPEFVHRITGLSLKEINEIKVS